MRQVARRSRSFARESTSSLRKLWARCHSTVLTVTTSWSAIWRFERPRAASSATWRSRSVRASTPETAVRRGRAPAVLASFFARATSASARSAAPGRAQGAAAREHRGAGPSGAASRRTRRACAPARAPPGTPPASAPPPRRLEPRLGAADHADAAQRAADRPGCPEGLGEFELALGQLIRLVRLAEHRQRDRGARAPRRHRRVVGAGVRAQLAAAPVVRQRTLDVALEKASRARVMSIAPWVAVWSPGPASAAARWRRAARKSPRSIMQLASTTRAPLRFSRQP